MLRLNSRLRETQQGTSAYVLVIRDTFSLLIVHVDVLDVRLSRLRLLVQPLVERLNYNLYLIVTLILMETSEHNSAFLEAY